MLLLLPFLVSCCSREGSIEDGSAAEAATAPPAGRMQGEQGQPQQQEEGGESISSPSMAAGKSSPSASHEPPVGPACTAARRPSRGRPPSPDVDAVLAGKALCGGSSVKLQQRLRRLRGAADTQSLCRVPLNIRRRLQQQQAAAVIRAAAQDFSPRCLRAGSLRMPEDPVQKAQNQTTPPKPLESTPEAARAANEGEPTAAPAEPTAADAAGRGAWRIVAKRRRRYCPSETSKGTRRAAAASPRTPEMESPMTNRQPAAADMPAPKSPTATAEAAEASEATAMERCLEACASLEAFAAAAGSSCENNPSSPFV